MFAIVDIETTGGYAAANGITEISIFIFDGNKIMEKFHSLVNPCQPIPRYIQAFTGINDSMVADAPKFEDIAEKVHQLLQDKVFIAHNVNFDYSFIKAGLLEAGYSLNTQRLCTIRLSRKIFPGLPSYSLGNLCDSLQIKINNRHRAEGDAEATVLLFQKLMAHDKEAHIKKSLKKNSKENMLPPNVPKEQFEELPSCPGVYYFHDSKGTAIYVGKAKNIRNRINSHFSSGFESRQKQNLLRYTFSISYETCATELIASILESTEIKKLWPAYNNSQKKREEEYGIYSFEDQNGYLRLAIEKIKKNIKPVCVFHFMVEGREVMRKLINEFNLCPKLCFYQSENEPCFAKAEEKCLGACERKESPKEYNDRVLKAIQSQSVQTSYAIIDKGLNEEERSCILVLNGRFFGMGYFPYDVSLTNPEELKEYITPYKENNFIQNLVSSYAAKFPTKVLTFTKLIHQINH